MSNILDLKWLGNLDLNLCYFCDSPIWSALPYDWMLWMIKIKTNFINFFYFGILCKCVCICRNAFSCWNQPVLVNLMPFKKKHTTISTTERIFNRTHCDPNIMNNSLFEPLRNDKIARNAKSLFPNNTPKKISKPIIQYDFRRWQRIDEQILTTM